MKEYSLEGKKGFGVLFESENWRIAYHVYEEAVNGMRAATQWGMHMDSQETFTLLQGTGYLVVQQQDGQLKSKGWNRIRCIWWNAENLMYLF